jgi:hypothetical protein
MPPARPRNGKEAGKSKWLCVRALPATSDGKICRIARALCEPVHTRSREKLRIGGDAADATKVYAFMMLDYLT